MGTNIAAWINEWFVEIVDVEPNSLTDQFIEAEITRFIRDAAIQNITRKQLEGICGNLSSYMGEEYERIVNEMDRERAGRGD